jgi:hypothetical protein
MNGREFDRPAVYHIRVKGNLEIRWSDWFGGLSITPQAGDVTMLTGTVADQAALHGLLAKIRDLGLPVMSVVRKDIAGLLDDSAARSSQVEGLAW